MARTRYATVIRALRAALAIALALFAALIGLYLFGRQGQPEPAEVASAPGSDEFAVRGEGFEFALTKGDQVVFEIRGREQRSDRAGKVYLEDVAIAMERGDGLYRVEGKRALYDQGTQEARLEGAVVIRGPRGMVVETDWLDLVDGGSRVQGRQGVRFATGQDLHGRADVLDADLDGKVLSLQGAVAVESAGAARVPFRLETEELVFREQAASAVARGGVTLTHGASRLTAKRLHLFFEPESRELELARLLSAVEGELATAPAVTEDEPVWRRGRRREAAAAHQPLTLRATSLQVRFDPPTGTPRQIDLRGLERKPARIVQEQPDGSVATLTVVGLVGDLPGGVLTRADLRGPIWLTQGGLRVRRGAERQVKALGGEARFDPVAGGLAGVTLEGEVWLREADALATGDRAYLDLRLDTFEIHGAPAHIEHPRGVLDAPRAVYRRAAGILEAQGGVAAVLTEGGAALAPGLAAGAATDEPLRVEAREAIWEAEPSSVRFLGKVRAWQGPNTIFAEQLRGEPDRGWMAASGGVRTLWHAPPEDADAPAEAAAERDASEGEGAPVVAERERPAAAPADAEGTAGTPQDEEDPDRPAGPLEIVSQELTYSQAEELLVYTGKVRAVQDWTTLSCERMTVRLDESGEADEIHCETAVRIVDARNQRTLEGDRAIYHPDVPEVEVFGDPLTVQDAAGNKVEGGRHFVYDLESGSSRLTARAAEGR